LTACSSGDSKPATRTFNMGEKAEAGHLVYTVFETQWLTQIPQDPTPRIPQHRFFLIRLSALNGAGGEVLVPNMTLIDDKGNSYEELSNGDGVVQWIGYVRKVKPAESLQGNVVFDVAPKHYKLRVTDEDGERAVLIDIPLDFGASTPSVPVPGEGEKK
jgi:hypothetical protein